MNGQVRIATPQYGIIIVFVDEWAGKDAYPTIWDNYGVAESMYDAGCCVVPKPLFGDVALQRLYT
ncbi:MAG: hypothetical protein QNJ47_22950 [Nostocaceae cyanobacterium]|nr:hypothetical protein [Nostocaceae cyanobacterium]